MLDVNGISFSYGRGAGSVLEDVSFHCGDGVCAAVLGNNGAGKSTLLKCIDRILRPTGGSVSVDGRRVSELSGNELARSVAYVAQNAGAAEMTVFDAVLLGRKPYIQWDATAEDRRIVSETLQAMKLDDRALRNISELSGGEAQKVMLARALVQQPRLLLLDEPTSNLDPSNQHEVMQLIRHIAKERNICVITVLHDLNLAIRYCDHFLFLKGNRLYASGGPETMTEETIEEVFGMHVHIIEHRGVPAVVPFPDVKPTVRHETRD